MLTLRSITKLSDAGNNINLLTTLETERLKQLMTKEKQSFDQARQAAQREVLASFGITLDQSPASDQMDISRAGQSNAALLAISAIMQYNRNEAELSELIAKTANDIRDNGHITQPELQSAISDGAQHINTETVRKNLTDRYAKLGATDIHIPDIYNYMDSNGDGILNGAQPYIQLAADQLTFDSKGDTTLCVTVHTNLKWTASLPADATGWLSIDSKTTGDLLRLTAKPNTGSPRTAQLILKEESGTLADTLNITQFGSHIQLIVNVKIANPSTEAAPKSIDPALESEVRNLVLIGFDQSGQLLFNRSVAELAFDTVNVSITTPHLGMNPYCKVYAIANDFDTYSQFAGDLPAFQKIRTHRDMDDLTLPLPRTCIKSMALNYNKINEVEIALVPRAAKLTVEIQLMQPDFNDTDEILDVTAEGIGSKSGLLFPEIGTAADTVYKNNHTVSALTDGKYVFYTYGYTTINRILFTVRRNNGITEVYGGKMQPVIFESGRLYSYFMKVYKGALIN